MNKKYQSKITAQQPKFWAFFYLTKPTITLLVVITAIPGLLLGSSLPSISISALTLLGTALMSSSAAVFNQVIEKDIDSNMERTCFRSIPAGCVSLTSGVIFGLTLGFCGFFILFNFTTSLAAWISLAAHLFYVVIYTVILKRRTAQNIVIGGISGAVGPLIACAAVYGELKWEAWVLFLIITLWTPPHFWALALKYKDDYAKAKIPMYPVVYGVKKTKREMTIYSFALIPAVLSLFVWGESSLIYLIAAGSLTIKFCFDALIIYFSDNENKLMPFFHFSCTYTFLVFGAFTLDRFIVLI